MAVIVFRSMYDPYKGTGISWRLHGQALPQRSVPIRFVLDDKPKLKLDDLLEVSEGGSINRDMQYVDKGIYRKNVDRATALGLLDNIIVDLVERPSSFWDEYVRFIAEHLPEAVPLAVKDLSKSKVEKCYLEMLSGLVKAGANINFIYEGKTAFDYAIEIHDAIPHKWMSGNRDHARNVIKTIEGAGAVTAAEATDYII